MRVSDFPKKRASSSELALTLEGFVRFIAHKPEVEKKALGAIFKVLFQHIRFQEGEIERITQARFSIIEPNEAARIPAPPPGNPSLGRVTNHLVTQKKEYTERGQRIWEFFKDPIMKDHYMHKLANGRTEDELKYEANTWARANGKETV